ncbi:hypothetical protein AYI70_g6996 [Smittium culicis]|uniref:Uncharacterized protein n=1 Tax=Smittium culicis TaxID=133412 RepID=A0A1R1XMH1_9FUNG|nr:hypothetical protein AYI70_g6996 [Smittium culicis]
MRKFAAIEEQDLFFNRMKDMRSILEAQGLTEVAINIIISIDRSIRLRSRLYSTQKKFLYWRISNNLPSPISVDTIVSYLAKIYEERK